MKNYIQIFFVLITLLTTTQAAASSKLSDYTIHKSDLKTLKTHQTISSVYLRINMVDDLHGFIDSKLCSFCKPIRIKITPNTLAYDNDVMVPLKHAKKRLGLRAFIIYNLKTKNISSIHW